TSIRRHEGGVPNEFVVLLSNDTPTQSVVGLARSLAGTYRLQLGDVWLNVVKGFSCTGDEFAIEALAHDPRVTAIEQNVAGPVPQRVTGTQYAWYQCPTCSNQYLWFLDRLDQSTW